MEVLKGDLWRCGLAFRACGYQKCWPRTWQITWLVLTFLPSALLTRWKSIRVYKLRQQQSQYSIKKKKKNLRAPALSSNQCEPWNESLKCAIFCRVGSKRWGKNIWHSTRLCFFVFLFGGKWKAAHKTQGTYRQCDPEHSTHFFLPPFSLKDSLFLGWAGCAATKQQTAANGYS